MFATSSDFVNLLNLLESEISVGGGICFGAYGPGDVLKMKQSLVLYSKLKSLTSYKFRLSHRFDPYNASRMQKFSFCIHHCSKSKILRQCQPHRLFLSEDLWILQDILIIRHRRDGPKELHTS